MDIVNDLTTDELNPHLLYRVEGGQARFATWKLETGHEALAIFTSAEKAESYRAELPPADWTLVQPQRAALIQILQGAAQAGILYAALDPLGGRARTLFDVPRVLAAATISQK